jgi:type IV secretory pathway TrbD component
MNPAEAALAKLDERLIRSLEARPVVQVPEGFAARVAGQVPMRRPVLLTPTHYGRNAMAVCMVVLAVAMLALALRSWERTPFGLALEWFVCAQFVALAMWLASWRRELQ